MCIDMDKDMLNVLMCKLMLILMRGCVYWNPWCQGKSVLFSSAIDENNLGRPPRPGDLLQTRSVQCRTARWPQFDALCSALPFLDPREQEIA